MDLTEQAIEKLLTTGRAQIPVTTEGSAEAYFIRPDGQPVSLASFYDPQRIKRTVTLLDANSFALYVNRFKDPWSVIFANVGDDAATFTAILDYHGMHDGAAPMPDFCDHVAKFTTQLTPEWKAWKAADRKPMSQVDFATWLEDNLNLFTSGAESAPTAGDLLELVQTLHGHQNARFNTALRLNTGAYSTNYDEDIEVKGTISTKAGSIELPRFIVGGFPLFHGCAAYRVDARLKTRIEARKLVIYFETVALPKLVRESLLGVVAQIEDTTKIKPLLGNP